MRNLPLFPPPSGHGRGLRRQRGTLPPTGGRAAQDGGRAGLQRDGRQGAELAHLHLPHHSRGRGGEARRPEAGGPAPVRQRRGKARQPKKKYSRRLLNGKRSEGRLIAGLKPESTFRRAAEKQVQCVLSREQKALSTGGTRVTQTVSLCVFTYHSVSKMEQMFFLSSAIL